MTDRGKFERLANAVLGKDNEDYKAVIAFGINAQNETIAGPSDVFYQIPGSEPPHFVWVQHTTTNRNRLKGKWLNENGDFIKSGRAASQLRKDFPNAQFTVVLSTNQRIPDESLATAVYKKADELNIKADVWEQSRYTRFLDSDRDGQYLRKTFLGTDAEMLSPDLLAELCQKSLEMYKKQEQLINPDSWISRGLDDHVSRKMGDMSCQVKLLVGESGFGKSVAAYRFLEKHLKSDRYGLFIPDGIIQDSVSLEDALGQILHKLYPALLSKEASLIHEIIPSGSQFVVVVDDVNRAGNPQKLIRNLTNWAKPPYLVVCPIWPRFQKQVQGIEHKPGIDVIDVDRMLVEEGRRAVESVASVAGLEISSIEAYSIAGGLGNDPYLIGAFGDLLRGIKHEGFENLVQDTIAKLIEKRLIDVTLANNRYFEHEYSQALLTLTSCMLRHKKLYPHWSEVELWLQQSGKHLDILRALCRCRNLCYISEGKFNFQHDRLLEHFCVESIVEFLSDPDKNADVLTEPYYAEMIGQALLRSLQSDLILNMIRDKLPLALVSAVRFMGNPTTDYHQSIARKVKDWVRVCAGPYNSSTPESIRGAVALSFLRTDSSVVLETVNTSFSLEKRWLGFARFRNGDARGAIEYCSIFGVRGGQDASLFAELVKHAKLHHREQLAKDLTQLLRSPDTKQELAGAPVLAGFLGLGELQNVIPDWWEQVTDKSKYLEDALWATLRCSNNLYQDEFLDSLMAYWANDLSRQTIIDKRLSSVPPFYADKNLIDYLISQSARYKSLRLPIAYICGRVDSPNSIEFAVRVCADEDDELEWPSIGHHWAFFDQPKLSCPSVVRLQDIWNDSGNSESVRELAFRLWVENVDNKRINVLELIRTVLPTEPLFKDAIRQRAWLGDKTCTPNLISILESDTYFFRIAHRVWCDEIIPVAEKHLRSFKENIPRDFSGGKLDEHYNLAEMLKAIPTEIAERLLIKHWEWLCYSRRFVQAALFVGTPQCLALAEAAIAECPASIDMFQYIDQFFGILAWGDALSVETITPPITLQRIQNLQPYLHRLDKMALDSFAAVCYLLGEKGIEWCRQYFPDSVNAACRKRYIPTEEDLIQALDIASDNHPNSMLHWLDKFKTRGDSRNPMEILTKWWLESEHTLKKLEAVARCIEVIGERKDLKLLDVPFKSLVEQQTAKAIRASATFAVLRRTLE